jgi:hypothetical protein
MTNTLAIDERQVWRINVSVCSFSSRLEFGCARFLPSVVVDRQFVLLPSNDFIQICDRIHSMLSASENPHRCENVSMVND